jgi:hypothetical protein
MSIFSIQVKRTQDRCLMRRNQHVCLFIGHKNCFFFLENQPEVGWLGEWLYPQLTRVQTPGLTSVCLIKT